MLNDRGKTSFKCHMSDVGIWISGYGNGMHKSVVIKDFYFILFLFFALVLCKSSKMVKYVRLGLTWKFFPFFQLQPFAEATVLSLTQSPGNN